MSHPLAFLVPGFTIRDVVSDDHQVRLTAVAATPSAVCPACGHESQRVHSYYTRTPRDLPISGRAVHLVLHVRRFRCLHTTCPTVTFAERLPELLSPAAQRTVRLSTALADLGLALGGEAGARQAERSGIRTNPDTLLRLTRQAATVTPARGPRVLGVDDFAFRKGRVYGTILVDGESHRPIDLLPDRTAETLARWLQSHPGVEIITRDRATEYARGATDGAPEAVQVADRWHVLGNLRQALERMLDRLRAQLLQQHGEGENAQDHQPQTISIYDRETRRSAQDQARQQQRAIKRLTLYTEVQELHAKGTPIIEIARQLHISRQMVRRYQAAEQVPETGLRPKQPSKIDPYAAYLQSRWDAGCRETKQLWQEISAQGYRGSVRPLVQWTQLRRERERGRRQKAGQRGTASGNGAYTSPSEQQTEVSPTKVRLPATRQLAWFVLGGSWGLDETEQQTLQQLRRHPQVGRAYELTKQFRQLVRDRKPTELEAWLEACQRSGIGELASFAAGLQREEAIVRAALEQRYSNGPVEGNVTRLKQIRRAMYGRGKLDLLRARVLAAA
jgi:transposase